MHIHLHVQLGSTCSVMLMSSQELVQRPHKSDSHAPQLSELHLILWVVTFMLQVGAYQEQYRAGQIP